MPKSSVRESFDLETRNKYTKVETEIIILVDGKELPNAALLGEALDKCIMLVKAVVAESYKVVPPRVDTPMAEPYPAPVVAQPPKPVVPAIPTTTHEEPVPAVPAVPPTPVVRIPSSFGN